MANENSEKERGKTENARALGEPVRKAISCLAVVKSARRRPYSPHRHNNNALYIEKERKKEKDTEKKCKEGKMEEQHTREEERQN